MEDLNRESKETEAALYHRESENLWSLQVELSQTQEALEHALEGEKSLTEALQHEKERHREEREALQKNIQWHSAQRAELSSKAMELSGLEEQIHHLKARNLNDPNLT